MTTVPDDRIAVVNDVEVRKPSRFVLYWMIASRRPTWNFGLQRAVEWAQRLDRPLVVLEALRADYRWASDRLHAFVMQGMADNARAFGSSPVLYYPYVERSPGEGKGLLAALAHHAAVVVTDDFPAFFLRRMVRAAATGMGIRLEAVDSNGLVPLRSTDRAYPTAYAFRFFLQKHLRTHLATFPADDPLARTTLPHASSLPRAILKRWPMAAGELLAGRSGALATLPIDHTVGVVDSIPGGHLAAERTLQEFLDHRLRRYPDERNQPEEEVTSGLSPYLHFGHVSAHAVFSALMTRERWTTRSIRGPVTGKKEGWWGASPAAEAFLDELVTWRELGGNMCHHRADYDRYESLPEWARATLDAHARDEREHLYTLAELEAGATHDPLWNAAQTQLRREGRMHNYLRMLWGKKILEWSATPRSALAALVELNNKYALDGRDPNSYAGIFWTLGRYDRPWAPERPVFGTVRYMSSENTARKLRVRGYIARYSGELPFSLG